MTFSNASNHILTESKHIPTKNPTFKYQKKKLKKNPYNPYSQVCVLRSSFAMEELQIKGHETNNQAIILSPTRSLRL